MGKRELIKLESASKYQVSQVEQNVQVSVNFASYVTTIASEYFSHEGDEVNPLYYDLQYNEEQDVFYMDKTHLNHGTFSSTLSGPGQIPVSQEAINELGFVFC